MKFEKYHGTGNDFILLFEQPKDIYETTRNICDRHRGIGADGLMYPTFKDEQVYMNYYNADGSRAPMCGNGIRCFSKFLEKNFDQSFPMVIETDAGVQTILKDGKNYIVNLGKATTKLSSNLYVDEITDKEIQTVLISGEPISYYVTNLGTIHTVIFGSSYKKYAKEISELHVFPQSTNVNFVDIDNVGNLRVETYERGVGWTLSCGTGVAASAWITYQNKQGLKKQTISVKGGILNVEVTDDLKVLLKGPAVLVASGKVFI